MQKIKQCDIYKYIIQNKRKGEIKAMNKTLDTVRERERERAALLENKSEANLGYKKIISILHLNCLKY